MKNKMVFAAFQISYIVLKSRNVYCGKYHESIQFAVMKDCTKWVNVGLSLKKYFRQEKQSYPYDLLDVDLGTYIRSTFLQREQLNSYENRAQEHIHILAGMPRRLEH